MIQRRETTLRTPSQPRIVLGPEDDGLTRHRVESEITEQGLASSTRRAGIPHHRPSSARNRARRRRRARGRTTAACRRAAWPAPAVGADDQRQVPVTRQQVPAPTPRTPAFAEGSNRPGRRRAPRHSPRLGVVHHDRQLVRRLVAHRRRCRFPLTRPSTLAMTKSPNSAAGLQRRGPRNSRPTMTARSATRENGRRAAGRRPPTPRRRWRTAPGRCRGKSPRRPRRAGRWPTVSTSLRVQTHG